MAPVPSVDLRAVRERLNTFRDTPVDNNGCSDVDLQLIYKYLIEHEATQDAPHWFCEQASPLTIDAATFLLRLRAYDSESVLVWLNKLKECLLGCAGCVKGLEEAKVTARDTYFGAYPRQTMDAFFQNLEGWQASIILESPAQDDSNCIYQMVSNLTILENPQVLARLDSNPPTRRFSAWPLNPPPVGLFPLLVHKNPQLREWARQCLTSQKIPMTLAQFAPAYKQVVTQLVDVLDTASPDPSFFTTDQVELWKGFRDFLSHLPTGALLPSSGQTVDIRRVIIAHLHDSGPQFVYVLHSFVFLLKRLGRDTWRGERSEYSLVVFDAVKDNDSFLELLSSAERPQWLLSYFSEFIHAVREVPSYGETLAKAVDFMCEELQHERFRDSRPAILLAAVQLLTAAYRGSLAAVEASAESSDKAPEVAKRLDTVLNVLDIHSEAIIAVAFDRAYNDGKWEDARKGSRELVKSLLMEDIHCLNQSIKMNFFGKNASNIYPMLRQSYWDRAFGCLQVDDHASYGLMIQAVAATAHLSPLHKPALEGYRRDKKVAPLTPNDRHAMEQINAHLLAIHSGFSKAITKYTNAHFSADISKLFRVTEDVVPNLILTMMSPVKLVSESAQSIIFAAFDVDGRPEGFQALLRDFPLPTTNALVTFLRSFMKYANSIPDACNLATGLVRCFTDVVEALCSSLDGLVHSQEFLKAGGKGEMTSALLHLWISMVGANCVIFSYARTWATFYDSNNMVEWMRDALIFGRDLMAQRVVLERAILSAANPTDPTADSKKVADVRKKMITELQAFLPQLAKWLRLTDEELLYQSFSLIESVLDCFRTTDTEPSEDGLVKLRKVVSDGRKNDRSATRLDKGRLSKLEALLECFDDDDDSASPPPKEIEKSKVSGSSAPRKAPHPVVKTVQAKITKPVASSLKIAKVREAARQSSTAHYSSYKLEDDTRVHPFRKASGSSTVSRQPDVAKPRPRTEPKNEAAGAVHEVKDSSSEDPDSDEDNDSKGINSLIKQERQASTKKTAEKRSIKIIDIPGVVHRPVQRPANQGKFKKLNPDLWPLHRAILCWSFDDKNPEPPQLRSRSSQLSVPDKFDDYNHYFRVFEPLLLRECWAQFQRSKDESMENMECSIKGKDNVNDCVDIDILLRGDVPPSWRVVETDIVLLTNRASNRSTLARAMSTIKNESGIIAKVRCYFANKHDDPGLQIDASKYIWNISRIFSLSTINREYAALVSLPYYGLQDLLLWPRLPTLANPKQSDIDSAMTSLRVNQPQAIAILSSLNSSGLSLIQGPPGTGKTATICGLTKRYLSQQPQPIKTPGASKRSNETPVVGPKILICAPSNAAIDEVARRIKDSFTGTTYKVIRIGADTAISNAVKDISLHSLVDEAMGATQSALDESIENMRRVQSSLHGLRASERQIREEMEAAQGNTIRLAELSQRLTSLNNQRRTHQEEFGAARQKRTSTRHAFDAERRSVVTKIINEAHVICSTLSGTGHESIQGCDFGLVVIDEAAQAIELSSLIPFHFPFHHCVLVGDSNQLPPTVISQEATRLGYSQSLFVRIQKQNVERVHLLSIQYRMHPEISQLPSRVFYDGRLQDGPSMAEKTGKPWHSHPKFGIYRFFDIKRGVEELVGQSQKNISECQVAVALYGRLRQEFSSQNFSVGVVTMYKAQLRELQTQFERRFGRDVAKWVDFNTVDGFQGQEKDVIILSCVRAGPGLQRVGFVADIRRMNVALTRARSSVFVLGNAATLERSDKTWASIVQNARERELLIDVDTSFFTSSTLATTPRVPVPSKKSTVPNPVIPDDLVPPNQYKALQAHSTTNIGQLPTNADNRGTKRPAEETPQEQLRDTKRPSITPENIEHSVREGPSIPREVLQSSTSTLQQPRPLAVKRQKATNAMFITNQFRRSNTVLQSVKKPKGQ
ncbi:hypothetical protein CCMSSC00406_0000782 [Pleurotus cornucopiae]|uniref:Uncharacterized protein n=1 Tax=Pleurotus cornucopiae TaxID=5321 RepID=A0ACB7JAC9_PLECO|nr:hypothetical protein CCMSSC00406_0000782 [Pleurotus cornucopiae]